jgi:HPt (histidine-containing phosphotransfer) domain-containing protein
LSPPGSELAAKELDVKSALERLDGDRTLYRRLLSIFVRVHAGSAQRCEEALLAGDHQGAMHEVHRLASAASGIGAAGLRSVSRAIEDRLRTRASWSPLPLVPTLLAEHAAVLADAVRRLTTPSHSLVPPFPCESSTISIARLSRAPALGALEPEPTLLDRLSLCANLIEQCDVAAVDCVESFSGLLPKTPRVVRFLARLDASVNDFDFDRARDALAALRECLSQPLST